MSHPAPSHPTGHSHEDGHDHAHHGGNRIYIIIFLALCALTTLSFLTYTDAWRNSLPKKVGWSFMMMVSSVKAFLVIAFFMHLKWEKSWKYILTIPTCMMAVFLVLMLIPDVGRREDHYSVERLKHTPVPKAVDTAPAGKH